MNTITAIIEPSSGGTLHAPVPSEWHNLPIRITAAMERLGAVAIKGYSAEWRQAIGSITDATSETPPRNSSRPVDSLGSEQMIVFVSPCFSRG